MKTHPFTRPTIVAAIRFIGASMSQAKFDQVIVDLELEQKIPLGPGPAQSVTAKSALLAKEVVQRSTDVIATINGQMTLAEAAVRLAVELTRPAHATAEQAPFLRGLALDGYAVTWEDEQPRAPLLRTALPEEIDLPATDDETHRLLKHFGFNVATGHLDQAIEAHTRGDWAAANSQIRTFLEGLLDAIALNIDAKQAGQLASSENRRAFLAERGFLSKQRNEWTDDGKNFINGLFKMLHTEGSHPGLSDEDRSTFRLHVALVTARTLLRRLHNGS